MVVRQPEADLDEEERVELGKQRAAAAVALLRHGENQAILDVLRSDSDPEALTQLYIARILGGCPSRSS